MLRRIQRNARRNTIISVAFFICMVPGMAKAGGFIDTPDECYIAQKIDKEAKSVQLATVGKCQGRVGRTFVDLDGEVTIYREGREWKRQTVQPMSMPDLSKTMKDAEKLAKTLTVSKNKFEKEMHAEALKTVAVYQSPEYQAKIAAETERIKGEMFHEQLKDLPTSRGGLKKDAEKLDPIADAPARLRNDERIYIFVSSSMPLETVRNYAASAGRYNDPQKIVLVMRGFIGGMQQIGPTTNYHTDVLKVRSTCNPASGEQCHLVNSKIMVDPILFRRYGINQVPATVYARGVNVNIPEQSEGNDDVAVGDFWTVYGDASLEYNLEQIRREAGSESLKRLLAYRK